MSAPGVMTAAELMAATFDPETVAEFSEWLCDLVDMGECHPLCLFGMEASGCTCRCEGLHHAAIRPTGRTE